MMPWWIIGLAGVVASIAAWFALRALTRAYGRYRAAFHAQTVTHLEDFFLFIDPRQVWGAAASGALVVALIVVMATGSVPLAMMLSAALAAMPFGGLRGLRRRRMARFERQLPDFLLSLAGALRAGAGLQGALQSIVAQSPVPLAQEFSMLLREQRMGVPLENAMEHLRQRMPVEGVLLLTSLLRIASGTGGNMAQTLEGVAKTLRDRLHLQGRIRALTAQGRMQAGIMACLPLLLGAALALLSPEAMAPLWRTPSGWVVMLLVLLLEFMGLWLVRRIVAIDV